MEVWPASNMNGHLQNQLAKSVERILEEAHLSGELKLSGRKIKDFPKIGGKYDLCDTVIADLSKNKFWELPSEILDFVFIERLHLYHNSLRSLPDRLGSLQYLKFLDLSRNQLCILPSGLCQLEYLEVLLIANNKLSALPNDIGSMKNLMELNASCNEISQLPISLGQLKYLKALDLRKNLLEELPIELTYLKLTLLDMSENRISSLPVELRLMTHLEKLKLNGNPLVSPPATICMRGRVHIFKFLETQVHKTDKKRSGTLKDVKRSQRKSDLRHPNGIAPETRVKRHTVDSGYSTSDGTDLKWSKDDKSGENTNKARPNAEIIPVSRGEQEDNVGRKIRSNCSTPSTISPGESFNDEDEFINRTVLMQDQIEAQRLIRLQSNDRGLFAGRAKEKSVKAITNGERNSPASEATSSGSNNVSSAEEKKKLEHVQTYREYKEARRLQRAQTQDVYRLKYSGGEVSWSNQSLTAEEEISAINNNNRSVNQDLNVSNGKKPVQKVIPSRNSNYSNCLMNGDSNHVPDYVKPNSPVKGSIGPSSECFSKSSTSSSPLPSGGIGIGNPDNSNGNVNSLVSKLKTCSSRPMKWSKDMTADKLSFTMRREFERAKEEAELIEQLRHHIEGRLKMSLPEEMGPALMDGVVLCHLANYVRPRSVATIHVPSPAVSDDDKSQTPKLTMARCRRNVDNFLDACRRIGVEENMICFSSDVLEGRGLVRVSITVAELLKFHTPKSPAHVHSQ